MEFDSGVSERVLALLRQWGWESGIQRLKEQIPDGCLESQPQVIRQFLGWLAAERGDFAQAEAELAPLTHVPEFAGWASLGLAFVAMREGHTDVGLNRLDQAESHAQHDPSLLGAIRLVQGATRFHRAETHDALCLLEEAACLISPERFSYGRVLDALGMWYAAQDNVPAAMEFFQQALQHKQQFQDEAGLAVSHGQVGRLHLEWGQFALAEKHFRQDLEISQRIDDRRGIAQMYNFLGQVALARLETEDAAVYLDHSIENAVGRWGNIEAFGRKDRALCFLADGQTTAAREQLDAAQRLFEHQSNPEGLAHVSRARGILWRLEQQWADSGQCLRRALQYFEEIRSMPEVARTRLELARLLKARGVPLPLIRDELLAAVNSAEQSRRPQLVQEADRELADVDPATGARHVYRRIRGRQIDGDSTSLTSAEHDIVTVFFFDLQGFTAWSRKNDPSVVLLCLNQMMATFLEATTRHDVQVIEYMGDGFLALSRGQNHARRAVAAALDLHAALDRLNRPRRILKLQEFTCRIGISTGEVVLGNVGTYDKIDYRAVGTTVNLAARIQNKAIPSCPCVSSTTWESVQSEFDCHSRLPRKLALKGLGRQPVFDICGRKASIPPK